MKLNRESIVRRLRGGYRGQTMLIITLALVGLFGAAAIVIDVGRVYYAYQELQAATQAAALAGGTVLSNEGETAAEAIATSTSYSAVSGDSNANNSGLLTNVTISAALRCLTSAAATNLGVPTCGTYQIGNYNAIRVTETATVPTLFARVVGFDSWTIGATALASAKGGFSGPYNVAIILDTTASMNDEDSDSNCNNTRIACALQGIQVLLSTLSPCLAGTSCPSIATSAATVYGVKGTGTPPYTATTSQGSETAYNVSTSPVDEVGLFVFPGFSSISPYVADDYACPAGNNSGGITPYNSGPVYQIIPFSSDYRTSDTAPATCVSGSSGWPDCALNSSSELVKAAGGASHCGVNAPGGEGTFYAGAIDTAQAQLVANARPNTKNVIILLSDGAANAGQTPSHMGGSVTKYPSSSTGGDCMQAVKSAQAAALAGTAMYTVAYGAEAGTSQCPTDTSPTMTPCETMEDMALAPGSTTPYSPNFYSDYTAKGSDSSCISASNPTSGLNQIFQAIGNSLTVSRLIPNGTT